MLLLRCHRRCLWIILGTVIARRGDRARDWRSPSRAGSRACSGRSRPTQVAHYAAMLLGTSAVLWMCRVITGRHMLVSLLVAVAVLVGTHTRTALLGGGGGARGRRRQPLPRPCAGPAHVRRSGACSAWSRPTVFASELTKWALRGQTTQEASQLTGRTKVWSAVFDTPRPTIEELFGSGPVQPVLQRPADRQQLGGHATSTRAGSASSSRRRSSSSCSCWRPPRSAAPSAPSRSSSSSTAWSPPSRRPGSARASPYLLDLTVAASLLVREGQVSQR